MKRSLNKQDAGMSRRAASRKTDRKQRSSLSAISKHTHLVVHDLVVGQVPLNDGHVEAVLRCFVHNRLQVTERRAREARHDVRYTDLWKTHTANAEDRGTTS